MTLRTLVPGSLFRSARGETWRYLGPSSTEWGVAWAERVEPKKEPMRDRFSTRARIEEVREP